MILKWFWSKKKFKIFSILLFLMASSLMSVGCFFVFCSLRLHFGMGIRKTSTCWYQHKNLKKKSEIFFSTQNHFKMILKWFWSKKKIKRFSIFFFLMASYRWVLGVFLYVFLFCSLRLHFGIGFDQVFVLLIKILKNIDFFFLTFKIVLKSF